MSTRCYVPALDPASKTLTLGRDIAHHVARVLRMAVGDALVLFDGQGRSCSATITSLSKQAVEVRCESFVEDAPPRPRITLVQSLIKPQAMDTVIRKACELGVACVQPVITEHSVVRSRERPDRWQKAMIAAAEQCGTNWLPAIGEVCSWSEWLSAHVPDDPGYICALQDAQPFKVVLREAGATDRVTICVGPEGDFTADELHHAREQGIVPVSLGELTLRADTAAIMAAAVLRYEFG